MNIQSEPPHLVSLILILPLLQAQPVAADEFQERRLLAPTAAEERLERQGRVYVYDGLLEETVDRAMDTQFNRVQSMMFVGTRYTTETGEEYAEDDCD